SADLMRTSQSRAVRSAEAVARTWPSRAQLRDLIRPSCSQLRGSTCVSLVDRSMKPKPPSRVPTNTRSPGGENTRADPRLRSQKVSDGDGDLGKPSGPRFQIESSLAPAAQRFTTTRWFWLSTAVPSQSDNGRALTVASQILFPVEAAQT